MDPNAMTKSQLKSALVGHDVSLPASARKSVFVGLYADHILFRNCNCRSATIRVKNGTKLPQMATSGFSSDDDIDDYIQPEQPKSSKGIFGWLTGVFAGKGDTGTCQDDVQTLPPRNPCNYDKITNNTKRGQQQRFSSPSNTKRGQQQRFSSPSNTKRGQQQRFSSPRNTKRGQQQRFSSPNNTKRGQQQRFSSPSNTKRGQQQRFSSPSNTKRGQQRFGGPYNTKRGQQQQRFSGPNSIKHGQQQRFSNFNNKRGQQRLGSPNNAKRGQQRLTNPNNNNHGQQRLFNPNNAQQQPQPRNSIQANANMRKPGQVQLGWSGPTQPQTKSSNSVINVFRRLGSTLLSSRNLSECLRGGGGIGDGVGRAKPYSPFVSPSMLRKRGLKPGEPTYVCLRRGREPKQDPIPVWSPCMLPTSDELNDRIRDQEKQKLGLYSQAKETKSHRAMETLPFTQEQIEVMSSAELMETLRQHGINCGPIVPSTRLVYQKKLLNMLSGGQVKWRHHKEGDEAVQHSGTVNSYDDEEDDDANIYDSSDEDDDDDEEMTPAELNIVQTKRGKAVAPERVLVSGGLPKSPRRRIVPEVRFSGSEEEPASRQRRQSSGMVVVEPGKPMKKERRVPLYLQIIIFIFVSIIIYLIVYNLEPVFKNPVSRLH